MVYFRLVPPFMHHQISFFNAILRALSYAKDFVLVMLPSSALTMFGILANLCVGPTSNYTHQIAHQITRIKLHALNYTHQIAHQITRTKLHAPNRKIAKSNSLRFSYLLQIC